MRKGALYFLLVLALVSGVSLYFFRDRSIESYIERTASDLNGGKVEIDNLHFSLLNLTFQFDRLQWTDPSDNWRNLFETGPVAFSMEVRPLFWKKFIIREVKVAGVMAGTKRATDGYWPKPPAEPGMFDEVLKSVETEIRAMPVFNLEALKQKANLDSLLNLDQLKVVQSATVLRSDIDSTGAYWQQFFKTYGAKEKIAVLESQAKAISVAEVKDVSGLLATLQKVNNLRANAVALQKEVTDTRHRAEGDFTRLTGVMKNLDNFAKDDLAAAKKRIGLSDFDVKDIGRLLFGNPFRDRFQEAMKYVDFGRRYLPAAQKLMAVNKVQKPPRFKGQDIAFPRTFAYPEFLLRNLHLSAAVGSAVGRNVPTSRDAEAIQITGDVSGITNEPPVYGKPTTFDVEVFKQNSNAYAVRGVLDHTGDIPADTFRVSAANFRLGTIDLQQNKTFLPSRVDGQRGTVSAMLAVCGDQIRGQVEMLVDHVEFIFADNSANDRVTQAIRSVFSAVDNFRLSAVAQGAAKDLQVRVSSNLDEIFAQRVRGIIQENLHRAQQEIRQRIDKEVAAHRKQAEALLAEKQALVMDEVGRYEKMLRDQVAVWRRRSRRSKRRLKPRRKRASRRRRRRWRSCLNRDHFAMHVNRRFCTLMV